MNEPIKDDVTEGQAASPPKVDPETLVLRAKPTRAIRFKRGMVVALAAMTSVSIVATAWVALRPSTFQIVGHTDDRSDYGRAPTDTLSALPSTYGDAPKLGPPLPGDLGRPILEHQRAKAGERGVGSNAGQQADQAAAAERERRFAEQRAARESGLMARSGPSTTGTVAPVS